ncbi:MAG: gluconate 2-dehydrogenase subunit 3 family protein, partial [Bacteroidota bacterium]
PSASEVKVHQIMDQFLGEVYTKEKQADYRKQFVTFQEYLGEQSFLKGNAEERLAILKQIDGSTEAIQQTFLNLKQQTIAYYLTTEEIGKNYLNYLPIPGEYEACISLEEAGGKAWAL